MRPIAFRIRDFKSIVDSGVCILSGDGITVLAGQNEAGKTVVLNALRDFDLEEEAEPKTPDYQPDDRPDARPTVSVQFELHVSRLESILKDDEVTIPNEVINHLRRNTKLWITRDLQTGTFALDETVSALWTQAEPPLGPNESANAEDEVSAPEDKSDGEKLRLLDAAEFAGWLRDHWPSFVYFDSFTDSLPREIDFALLQPTGGKTKSPVQPGSMATGRTAGPKAPDSVQDLVIMADLDVEKVANLSGQDKALRNYLSSRSASVTTDFLTYWKQKVDQEETIELRIRHLRDTEGTLKLVFYIHDTSDKYPDQRSKGFTWFLSFYLRLAAARKKYPNRERLLLIDEPGSYLHARAQKDVLHLFEDRIVPKDQIIYSTHSPYLITQNGLHRLRIVLKTTNSGTRVLDRLTHPDLRGKEFADSLSPVIAAIGIDISQSINFNKERNLFVEGFSDLMYLTAWAKLFKPEINQKFNIFPGTGATTVLLLSSLFIGWGFDFVVLLDNDDQGKATQDKLTRELSVAASRIVRPRDAKAIEDLFSVEDFRSLLAEMDEALTLDQGESPLAAVRRQKIDKVLLARTFGERASQGKLYLTKKTQDGITRLLNDIWNAWQS